MSFYLELLLAVLVLLMILPLLIGMIRIREREVGIVIKRFGGRSLAPGQLLALNGESGIQADTLAPGLHFGYWVWQYRILRVPVTVIPQGEIGLVVSAAGEAIPTDRILAKVVECDHFQDARRFLMNGGEKGRQIGILTAGTYRIHTVLFTVITAENARKHGMEPSQLEVYSVRSDMVGIVMTLDGAPIEAGEISGSVIAGHENFQNPQVFLSAGGRRGLQEQVLLSGTWNLNPWFVQVEQVPMTQIPIGHVGVVISYVGKAHEDVSGIEFKHGDLVNVGHKGVWVSPLFPGKHPINTRVMKIELVPTTNIVLNWAMRTEAHNYDAKLSSITVRSKDGFGFSLDVAQVIHVGALDAPRVISRVGSMQNLVDHVLQPIVGNYFRNAAQLYGVLDFLGARSQRQAEAGEHIRRALALYDVQAIDTLIGDINPPADLMKTLTERKIAEEQKKTFELQEAAQVQRQRLVHETALADIQESIVQADQGVRIAGLKAEAAVKEAEGGAQATRLVGLARAEAYKAGAEAIGPQSFSALQLMKVAGRQKVRIVPDVSVTGANGSNGLADALLGMVMKKN